MVKDEICEAGIRFEGTVNCRAPLGHSRRIYSERYTDEASKRLMRGIKLLFDPVASSTPDAAIV